MIERRLARRRIARAALTPLLVCVALALVRVPSAAGQDSVPDTTLPAAQGYVNDVAQVLSPTTRARLEAFLDQVQKKAGAQFAVLTVPTTAPLDPRDYKVRVFERWGLGRRGEDDGLLMLVAITERQVVFETGYGLEGALPDGWQSRLVREVMRPLLRQGDYDRAIVAGVLECSKRIATEKGVTLEWDGRELRYSQAERMPRWIVGAVLVIFLLVVVFSIVNRNTDDPRRRRRRGGFWGGPWDSGGWGGGRWGGGGWGGGGWGTGGGFGGGGSFGGFGGGSSGGGGGGGSW